METIFLIIHVIIAISLVSIILLQSSSSDSLSGLSGGSSTLGGVVSRRASVNFLTKTTAILVALFMINSLILGNLFNRKANKNLIDNTSKIERNGEINGKEEIKIPVAE